MTSERRFEPPEGGTVNVLLVVSVLCPVVTCLAGRAGRRAGRIAVAATALATAAAVVVAVVVTLDGPVSAVITTGSTESVVIGFTADRVSILLLLLVLGVSAVVQAFSRRYLRGDPRAGRFAGGTAAITTATAAMVTSATLIGLALAWSAIGLGLWWLLWVYRADAWVPQAVARTARMVVVGDVALWTAVVVATVHWGNVDLRTLDLPTTTSAEGAVVAVMLVVAAIARSALIPMSGWLPATVAAPTPLSALLHAGIVNGGGVLMIRVHPMIDSSVTAMLLAFAAGALTAVYGTAVMLTRPDLKSALAYSTVGQMGFMVMTCALGAYSAALFHLLAHGMYKSTLFLGSGSAVADHLADRSAPPAPALRPSARRAYAAVAVVVPVVVLAAALWLWQAGLGIAHQGTAVILAFAWATGTRLMWGWTRRATGPGSVVTFTLALAAVMVAYLGALKALSSFVDPTLQAAGPAALAGWTLVPVFAAMALLSAVRFAPVPGLADVRKNIYVASLSAGDQGPRPLPLPPRPAGAEPPAPARTLAPAVRGES